MKPSRPVTFGGVRRRTFRGMRKITKAALLGGAAAAAIAATVGMASPASASEASFENAVYYETGYSGSDIVDLGYVTCDAITGARNANMPPAGTMGALVGIYLDSGFSSSDAGAIVAYAVTELCPSNIDYAYEGVDGVSGGGSLYA